MEKVEQGQAPRSAEVPVDDAYEPLTLGEQISNPEVAVTEAARYLRERVVELAGDSANGICLIGRACRSNDARSVNERPVWFAISCSLKSDEEVDAVRE